jgi:hypothetical protein
MEVLTSAGRVLDVIDVVLALVLNVFLIIFASVRPLPRVFSLNRSLFSQLQTPLFYFLILAVGSVAAANAGIALFAYVCLVRLSAGAVSRSWLIVK